MKKITLLNGMITLVVLILPLCHSDDIPFTHQVVDDQNPKDPWVKITGDIDGDGFEDIIIGGRKGPVVWYRYPDWKKTKIGEGDYNTVDGEVGDIDRDGDLDVMVGANLWFENPSPQDKADKGLWKPHHISDIRTHDIELADLDGDKDLDLIARDQSGFNHNTGNKIHIWRQDSPDQWTYRAIDCPHGEGLTLYDLDRDGDLDIIAGRRWYENKGSIQAGQWTAFAFAPGWHQDTVVQAGDINGDGRADLVLTRSEGKLRLSWFEAPADPTQVPWKEHVIDSSVDFAHSLRLADMDQDGDVDVVTAEMHQSDRDRVMVYYNGGRGSSWKRQVLARTGCHAIRLFDMGNNHTIDIMGANWSGAYQPIELWINTMK